MWPQSIMMVLACIQVSGMGIAVLQLKLIEFHNHDGKEDNGICCESLFSSTCSSISPFNCDPSLKVCVDDLYSTTECAEGQWRYTGEYENTNSFRFGSTFNNGHNNPMEFRITQSALKITIGVEDIDGFLGGDHDFMGKSSVIYENLVTRRSDDTWNDITFHYKYQTITAQARAYCIDHYYGANCAVYCNPNEHYTCDEDGVKVCRDNYYGQSCLVHCQPQDRSAGHLTCSDDGTSICNDGWTGEMCTEDIDECRDTTDNPCLPNGSCTNTDGSYYCVCDVHTGWTGEMCTEDIDECRDTTDNPCLPNGSCTNTDGSYYCVCDDHTGWTGEMCTEDIDECGDTTGHPCLPNGSCTNTDGSYYCVCDDAHTGRDCQDVRLHCEENPCSNHISLCNDRPGGFQCVCVLGWTGDICDEQVTPCTNSPCRHNATCAVVSDSYECNCTEQWQGATCETAKPEDRWVTRHWYIIPIVVIVIFLTIAGIIVYCILRRRRPAIMKKSGFDYHILKQDDI